MVAFPEIFKGLAAVVVTMCRVSPCAPTGMVWHSYVCDTTGSKYPVDFSDRFDGIVEMFEQMMSKDFLPAATVKRPRIFIQVNNCIDTRQRHTVYV